MAGDWIKFETATLEKPEVIEMAELLKIDVDEVIGKLIRVWVWFNEHTKNGHVTSRSRHAPVTVASRLNHAVRHADFCDAMKKVGWLIEKNGELIMPNFQRLNGKSAKERALAAKRAKRYRDKQRNQREKKHSQNRHATVTVDALLEKRREEKNKNMKEKIYKKEKSTFEKSDLTKNSNGIINSQFDEFWQTYPKKTGKKYAKQIFQKLNPDPELFAGMLASLREIIRVRWQFTEKQFIPNPATWLNQARWDDEIIPFASPLPKSAVERVREYNRAADERERLNCERDITPNKTSEVH